MMRIDALLMNVQLNIRQVLYEEGLPDINIIGEKVGGRGEWICD